MYCPRNSTHALDPERAEELAALALSSRERQAEIDAADDSDFDAFLARYFAQTLADTA